MRFNKNSMAQVGTMELVLSVAIGLIVLAAIFSLAPVIGDRIDNAATLEHNAAATGTLTFSGVVADGQTVNIDTDRYEFDTDSSITGGNIAVALEGQVAATGAILFSGDTEDGETINIGTDCYEFDTDGSITGGNIRLNLNLSGMPSLSPLNAAVQFTAAVTASDTEGVGAVRSSQTVTLTADTPGTSGNSVATTETCANAAFGAATLTGGANADVTATNAATQFTSAVTASDTVGVGASRSGNAVMLTADTPGTSGNSVATTETCTNAAFGAATLTGGGAGGVWADEDIPTGVDIWSDNASLISLVVLVMIISLAIFYIRRMGGGGGGM